MKRVNVRICDRFLEAWDLEQVLSRAGINVKIVTKHAVQIPPEQMEEAKAACAVERKRRASEEQLRECARSV